MQNGRLKKDHQFSICFAKISGIGPWVSRINWCKGHWFCSTYNAPSINLSYLSKDQSLKFCQINIENCWSLKNSALFWVRHFGIFFVKFFLPYFYLNQSQINGVALMRLNFYDYHDFHNYGTHCSRSIERRTNLSTQGKYTYSSHFTNWVWFFSIKFCWNTFLVESI